MPTTIQITDQTLELLKRVKAQLNAASYDEAIHRIISTRTKSFAGLLGKQLTAQQKEMLLRNDRDTTNRF